MLKKNNNTNSQYIHKNSYILGVDIGGTNIRIGAIRKDGSLIHQKIDSSRQLFKTEGAVQALGDYLESFMLDSPGKLQGICIGFPGTVSKDKKTVLSIPHLSNFSGKNIGGILSERFGVPTICEHDVILLLANDINLLKLSSQDCIIALYIGTGIGNALYINNKFYYGKNGVSGELGHIPVLGSSDLCPCGNTGCLELYSSGKRLEQIKETYFTDLDDFGKLFTLHREHSIVQEFVDCIAVAAATEINILDPDIVLLSGGVINMPDFPYEKLLERIRTHTRKPYPSENLCFVRGTLDKCAGIRGAGLYLWERLSKAK